jgi:hypothetical protein
MTKRERALFNSLKRLRDALWDHGNIDPESVDPRLNRAYMSANGLIGTIEREIAERRTHSNASHAYAIAEAHAERGVNSCDDQNFHADDSQPAGVEKVIEAE